MSHDDPVTVVGVLAVGINYKGQRHHDVSHDCASAPRGEPTMNQLFVLSSRGRDRILSRNADFSG